MPEGMAPDEPLPKPDIVDVVPVETVEPLMARHEEELRALRLELEEALRSAETAERRLSAHPAAAVYDDAFEGQVLAHVSRSVSELEHGPGVDTAAALTATSHPAPGNAGRTPSPAAAISFPTHTEPTVDQPPMVPGTSPSPRPRTVVVDRGLPRTVVVDRNAPPTRTLTPPPPTPTTPPVSVADPGAEEYVTCKASLAADEGGRPKRQSGRTSKVPARLLIQAGVVIVIIALVLLKLG